MPPTLRRPKRVSDDHLELLDEIETAMKSQRSRRPSLEELFVMALLFEPNATLSEALRWVIGISPHHRKRALDFFTSNLIHSQGRSKLHTDFSDLQRRFDLPISNSEDKNDEAMFYVAHNEARIFLSDFLSSAAAPNQQEQPFRFTDLPPELRLRIYELVLAFPPSGVMIKRNTASSVSELFTLSRSFHDQEKSVWERVDPYRPTDPYRRDSHQALECKTLPQHLALLQTSKQIYSEAMPVFYSTNSFICLHLQQLDDLFSYTSEDRKKHIRDITLYFDVPSRTSRSPSQAAKCFKAMKSLEGLRRFGLIFNEDRWERETKRDGSRKYPDTLKLAPFQVLRTMRGLQKVDFYGDCDKVRDYLAEEMTKPAPAKKQAHKATDGSKRKSKGGDEDKKEAGARKLKRGKKAKAT